MERNLDIRPGAKAVSSSEPSRLWVVGLARDDDSSPAESAGRPYSYMADCECPDDCQRDHENE